MTTLISRLKCATGSTYAAAAVALARTDQRPWGPWGRGWLWHRWCQEAQVGDLKSKAGDPLHKPGEGSVVG